MELEVPSPNGLYYTFINTIEISVVINQKFTNNDRFNVWHDRLGHPGTNMMRKIIENSCEHSLKCQQIPQSKD